jgi:hypothetical protein
MTTIHIKQIGRSQTKFSVNGKLCIVNVSVKRKVIIQYSEKTNQFEREFFKKYLEVLNII